MTNRFVGLLLILCCMSVVVHTELFETSATVSSTLLLGFLLLAAYCIGSFLEAFGLPRITGYIATGLLLGPHFLNFYSASAIAELDFLNSMALAFIAFCAGGELKLEQIRRNVKSIFCLIAGVTSVVFFGVSFTVMGISSLIPFMAGYPPTVRFAISALFGVIAVARSPSSAFAIISETKAKGEYTNIVLSVTIAMDVCIIILFGIVISVCQIAISSTGTFHPAFFLNLLLELCIAIALGFLLGKGIVLLLEKAEMEFPVLIAAVGFLVIKFSHLLGEYFHETHDISVNVEPLLMCLAAGFVVQNFSRHGSLFLNRMDRVSLPIYVVFFAVTGAAINVDIVKASWMLGAVIVIVRIAMVCIGSYTSGRIAGDAPRIYRHTWLGFITQAGVSIGLLSEIARRFPEVGVPIQSILIASITVDQIVGPIAFKYALHRVGETNVKGSGK